MLRLWIDDERPMREGFDVHAKTAEEAISILSQGNVEHVSFDHDLGGEKTGNDVAKWIEEQAYVNDFPKITWDVHSANPPGAANIRAAMNSCERIWNSR